MYVTFMEKTAKRFGRLIHKQKTVFFLLSIDAGAPHGVMAHEDLRNKENHHLRVFCKTN